MKAVFLDRATFSADLSLPAPNGVTDYRVFDTTPNEDKIIVERCQAAEIILTNKVMLTADIITQLPKLKLIQLTATGMNNVAMSACQAQGVCVKNVAGYAVKSVPEHTFMLLLSVMRAGIHYHREATSGASNAEKGSTWQADGRFCLLDLPIVDLENKTLGIIGAGVIGRRVGEIANAFGMRVLYAEHPNTPPRNADYTAFETVLAQADVLSLHCPLTEQTKHLINANSIAKMVKRPLIVNVARGGVVDSQAVATAVQQGDLFGYASDVFEQEPLPTSDPLWAIKDHPRVHFTPHNAWGSANAQLKLWGMLCEQVTDFIAND